MNEEGLVSQWRQQRTKLGRAENASEFIPTWMVGTIQPQPHNVRRYVETGYEQNSLIYACIKEKATSFASLKTQVVRRDGKVADGHRLTVLLDNPNEYQDGQDFAELLKTQFEAAGNVYIHKVRQSTNRNRAQAFATFPVQELELIRPDYVTIEPGPTREMDTFIVTIAGKIAARIPRENMIHIHEPSLSNDFYGTPKLSLLAREGAIDLSMSDFELAFFRNAGVPMGLLSVKGNKSKSERDEIKGAFRRAYNGLRQWFDLLVLNGDEASYTQLGMKQSDMEMDATRFHVESRVCSTFGVPGIIVGARYAMQAGSQQSYEEAEHAFWAETMVPDAMRIARAWQKFLLPEFAVQADRGAVVSYDFTVVRALQEDRSRKLREVVRMVLTGGFTVNQALRIVGLDAVDGGDFYIRNGNQVVVTPDGQMTRMAPDSGSGNIPNLDHPLEGAARLDGERAIAEVLSIFNQGGGV